MLSTMADSGDSGTRLSPALIEQTRDHTPRWGEFAEPTPVLAENYLFARELANIPAVQHLSLTPTAASSRAPLVVAR